jgi:hypothetical protein
MEGRLVVKCVLFLESAIGRGSGAPPPGYSLGRNKKQVLKYNLGSFVVEEVVVCELTFLSKGGTVLWR